MLKKDIKCCKIKIIRCNIIKLEKNMKKKIYIFILILISTSIIFSNKAHAINKYIDGNFATDGSTIRIFEGQELKIDYKSTWDNNDGTIAMKIKNDTYYNGYTRDSNNKKQWTEKHYYEDSNFKVELKNHTVKKVEISGITYRNYKDIYFYGKKATNKPIKITIISETGKEQQLSIEILAPLNVTAYEGTKEGKFDNSIDLEQKFKNWGMTSLKIGSNSVDIAASEGTDFNSKQKKIGKTQYNLYEQANYDVYIKSAYVRFRGKTKRRIRWKYSG